MRTVTLLLTAGLQHAMGRGHTAWAPGLTLLLQLLLVMLGFPSLGSRSPRPRCSSGTWRMCSQHIGSLKAL